MNNYLHEVFCKSQIAVHYACNLSDKSIEHNLIMIHHVSHVILYNKSTNEYPLLQKKIIQIHIHISFVATIVNQPEIYASDSVILIVSLTGKASTY